MPPPWQRYLGNDELGDMIPPECDAGSGEVSADIATFTTRYAFQEETLVVYIDGVAYRASTDTDSFSSINGVGKTFTLSFNVIKHNLPSAGDAQRVTYRYLSNLLDMTGNKVLMA